jgi:hypothetical protein
LQTSFLGGSWSPYAQGRADKEQYRTALNLCYNGLPVEEGAWTRRPATVFAATTRSGAQGLLREFAFNQAQPLTLEFTAGHLRLFSGLSLMLEDPRAVGSISTADPAVVTTPTTHPYATGDQVQFSLQPVVPGNPIGSGIYPIFGRQFSITVSDSTHFSLQDPITGANIDGSTFSLSGWVATVARVVDIATPYTAAEIEASSIRVIQDMAVAIICDGLHVPEVLSYTAGSNFLPLPGEAENDACFPLFNFGTAQFVDGPYFDPPTDGSTLTATGGGSPVTLNASAITSINGGLGFLSTDVGRAVRLFSEPPNWASGTSYTKGQTVKWEGAYWQALQSSTGSQPDTSVANWAVTTAAAAWTWGNISAVNSTSQIVVALAAADPYGIYAGGTMLNTTQPVVTWQMGVYSNTTGWPTGGTYHEGRFWLFGAQANRADATMSDNGGTPEAQNLRFNPTAIDGTVADDNGISIELQAEQVNSIFWMVGSNGGIVMGTQGGEFLIRASETNDPITPASVQAKRVTKFGCANVEPRQMPLAIAFVDRYNKKLIEYLQDPFSGRSLGFNLSINSGDLMAEGMQELAYVQERTPVLWARMGDGTLKGCSYKRESPFGTQPASFYGWHEHVLGSGRTVESIQAGPSPGGATDALVLISNDPATNVRWVEMMSPLFDETDAITAANYVDAAIVPDFADIETANQVTFYGLEPLNGKTLTAWFGGVDAGDYTVASGKLTVPINVAGGVLTTAYLQALSDGDYGYLDTVINVSGQGGGFYSPIGSAIDYTQAHNSNAHYAQMDQTATFDWDAGRFYYWDGNDFFHVFNIATQAEIAGVSSSDELLMSDATCLGYDGQIYYGTGTSASLVNRFNVGTLATDQSFNDLTNSLSAAGYVCAIDAGGTQMVLVTGLNSGTGGGSSAPWYVVEMGSTPVAANSSTMGFFDEQQTSLSSGNAYPLRGPGGSLNCHAWGSALVFVYGTVNAGVSFQVGFYQIIAEPFAAGPLAGSRKIGVITPSQVHAGLTSVTIPDVYGMVYDETDGNALIILEGNNSQFYLCKISTFNAAVLWSIAVSGAVNFRTSRVRGGKFSWIDSTGTDTLFEINTITGAVTDVHEVVFAPASYSTDDKAGMIITQVGNIGTTNWATFGPNSGGGTLTPAVTYKAPVALGFNYASRGQLLRQVDPQTSGARNGPALGKTRRTHMAAYQLSQVGVGSFYYGTDFATTQHKATFNTYPGGTVALPLTDLYAGVFWTTIEDPYGFDGMISWEVRRPYPASVVAVQGYLHTQDR